MKRYSIMVRERGASSEVELCQCATNPEALVQGAKNKFLMIDGGISSRRVRVPKYEHVYFIDHEVKQAAQP